MSFVPSCLFAFFSSVIIANWQDCFSIDCIFTSHLQKVVSLALKFNVPEDEESVKLQAMIQAKGKQAALAEVSGLLEDHPLIQSIIKL